MKTSISNINWQQTQFDERLSLALQQKFELPEIVAQLLASKQIDLADAENFLNPAIKTSLPDPFLLKDMEKAVAHAIAAILNHKKITLFADYDVDGATSSALLKKFFDAIGVDVGIYIPDRIQEGYGPNAEALIGLKKNGTDLVITLDCGAVAFEPLEKAHQAGLDIIVIDHHIGVVDLPKALAVINPNRVDEDFAHKNICAAGVAFLFAIALNKKLREISFYQGALGGNILQDLLKKYDLQLESEKLELKTVKEPNLLQLLDLVALGTVCDVMPLTGLNRAFVAQGLKVMKQRTNLGIRALCDVANLDEEPKSYHLGFILGPRINAGGRVGKANLGATILSTKDEAQATLIAAQLDEFNNQRKEIEASALEEAIENLEKNKNGYSKNDDVIFATSNSWHQGVIGIIASRLKDLYGKPVAVITVDENGKGKASCRSIKGIDFGGAILNARLNGLVIEGGGHAMAGGFSVQAEKIKELHEFFTKSMSQKVRQILQQNIREFDIGLDLINVNLDLIRMLHKLEPYGTGNYKPKFLLRDVRKLNVRLIGQDQSHVSCTFSSLSNVGFANAIQGVAFRAAQNPIGQILLDDSFKKPISVIGDIAINSFMGKDRLQIVVEDVII